MYIKENAQAGKASGGAPPNAPALLLFLHAARCLCRMPGHPAPLGHYPRRR